MKTKRIQVKDLKPGMKIKTYDPGTGANVYKEVTHKWESIVEVEKQRTLIFTNGTTLDCSFNHPIMVYRNGSVVEVYPDDLSRNDNIITESGLCNLETISKSYNNETYIDITVKDTHTFFASNNKNDKMILTHNSQGGVRGGAATLHYPFWHLEVEDFLVLKNNKGTEENRLRHMDYSVQFNKVMYERLLEGGNITLFSPHDCPDLYDAFFVDVDLFRALYEKYERSTKIRKKTVPAIDLFSAFMQERKDTGRIYFQNVDHCNDHGSFKKEVAPIKMSNLCQEITLPTTPLQDINDENGEISLCTLSAVNWGKIKKPSDFEKPCTLAVRALDALLDYQSYPVRAAEIGTKNRRPLGVGIINFAYWLARNGSNYTNPNLDLVHEYAEAWSYYLIKASIDLAEEYGPCLKSSDTLYSEGIMPIDTYKKDVDDLVAPNYKMDWEALRERAKMFEIRNSTLMALMPAECQSLNNEVMMADGTSRRLDELINEYGMIDIDAVHNAHMIGQRFPLAKPIKLFDSIAYEVYYNGPQSVTEIEFEDGNVYRFTNNHKLLVLRDGNEMWTTVDCLLESDDIVSVPNPS